jgi:D-sedoheptulose 7-phosphate isomerase
MPISTADEAADSRIAAALEESIAVKRAVLDAGVVDIARAAGWIVEALRRGSKIILFGNGGSAADCQHVAAELVGRFEREGRGLPALALTVDTSALTALANDYGFEAVFARQIQALGRSDDVALAFSTSGDSANVIAGAEAARATGARTIALTGRDGGQLAGLCDLAIRVPSSRTSRIQEAHITICHAICEIVEAELRA